MKQLYSNKDLLKIFFKSGIVENLQNSEKYKDKNKNMESYYWNMITINTLVSFSTCLLFYI